MTIVALHATDERVLLGVDTFSETPDGRRIEVSKIHFIPHLNALITGRGNMMLPVMAAQRLMLLAAASFRDAVSILDRDLPLFVETAAAYQAQMGEVVPAQADIRGVQDLLLIGYDESVGRMAVFAYHKEAQGKFERTEIGGSYVAPLPDPAPFDLAVGWQPRSDDDFVQLAQAQVVEGRKVVPGGQWGGRLLMAAITREAFSCRSMGEL